MSKVIKNQIILYLPTKPPLEHYKNKRGLKNLKPLEVSSIISETGNHWRKIFSIYAKIGLHFNAKEVKTWQEYRDTVLLTKDGMEQISFSSKLDLADDNKIHLISGKNTAEKFDLDLKKFKKLDDEGRILFYKNIYLTPYFDYRQFPNALIDKLIEKLQKHLA